LEGTRGVRKLSHFSLGLFLHPWRFSPFGVGKEDGLRMRDVDTNEEHK